MRRICRVAGATRRRRASPDVPAVQDLPWFGDFHWEHLTRDHPLIAGFERLWVVSDTHFFHERLRTVLAPGSRPDDVDSVMARAWQSAVADDDVVLHLGDVAVGQVPPADYPRLLPRLPGRIYLVPGNHDRSRSKLTAYESMGWHLVAPFRCQWRGRTIHVSHEPIDEALLGRRGMNVHGHIHDRPALSERHINVSVEMTGFAPRRMADVLARTVDISTAWGAR